MVERHLMLTLRDNLPEPSRRRILDQAAALGARPVVVLPRAFILFGPEESCSRLAAIPGVAHAGSVTFTPPPIRRLRAGPDGHVREVTG
ncbi:hypothetical protein AAFN86_02745 [Roseomonas sp. CAU 1739]